MKTKYWVLILGGILVLSLLACVPFLTAETAHKAVITSDGTTIMTVDLTEDQEFEVASPNGGTNTITVKDGKIAVTAATCPDHYCMHRGFCDGGTAIVCLPNKLVIEFTNDEAVDGAVG